MCLSMTKDSDFFENEIFLPRPQIASVVKRNHLQSQPYAAGVQEALGFSVLKYAFFHFLETHFLSFLTFISAPKMDKVLPSS